MNLVSFQNASFLLQGQTVLKNVNLEIRHKRHVFISGRNGSGKTTLCRALSRKLRSSSGHVIYSHLNFDDIQLVSFTDTGSLFHSVNNLHYYQQRFNSWDSDGHLTMQDYLLAKGIDPEEGETQILLKKLNLDQLLQRERIKLSSGQTRKMLLASAILRWPKLLILDNAYIGLDQGARTILNEFLDQLVQNLDITLIISGHASTLPSCITTEIKLVNDQVMCMDYNEGNIALKESLRDFNSEASTKLLGEELCLSFRDVTVGYKGTEVLSNLNWKVSKGEHWGIMGSNGSGKSTLVSLIYADHPQLYSQDIEIFGLKPGRGVSIWEIKKLIGFTSPELHAYIKTGLTCAEVIATGLWDRLEMMEVISPDRELSIKKMLDWFHLGHLSDSQYQYVSTGQQRICLFLRALVKNPKILLLDEPFQGMDEHNIEIAKDILQEKFSEQTLLFISHYQHEFPSSVTRLLKI